MINQTDRTRLVEQLKAGRGLWIGFFPTGKPSDFANPLQEFWPEDAHVTLTHLGKGNSEDVFHRVEQALGRIGSRQISAEVTGFGMFWRKNPTVFALVNSAALFTERAMLLTNLKAEGVSFDERFGFIPHITLNTNDFAKLSCAQGVLEARSFTTRFNLGIVCGDVTVIL